MKTISLDTNVVLRHLLDDIPDQVKKLDVYVEKAKKGKVRLYTPLPLVCNKKFDRRWSDVVS